MHEHLLFGYPAVRAAWPHSFDRAEALARVIGRVTEARDAGVDTLVDCTGVDIGRDGAFAAEVARQTGLRIIMATGFVLDVPRYFLGRSASTAARFLQHDITVGIDGTAIRAAIIKVASRAEMLTGLWELAFRAAARAHRATGVPITTHTDSSLRNGIDQQRVLLQEGVDLSRVIIGHSGDTEDLDYLRRLLDRGSYLGMDRFGLDQFAGRPVTIRRRCEVIADLCRAGYASQLVLSHDTTCYCVHTLVSPDEAGYETAEEALAWWDRSYPDMRPSRMATLVIPTLLELGVSQVEVDQMTRANPKAIFDNQAPY
jgi:phosphotriesterase-related protein